MFIRTASITWTHAHIRDVLDSLADAGEAAALFDGLKYKYFTDQIDPTADSALGDFTIAALGTAGGDVTWQEVINLDDDKHALKAQCEDIAGAGPTVENLEGILILNTAMDTLLGAYRFPAAVPIANEGDAVSVDVIAALSTTWDSDVT